VQVQLVQDAVLFHRSEHLANSFSQGLCKFNLALNELQVALGLGTHASRRGFISRNNYLLCSLELIFPQALRGARSTTTSNACYDDSVPPRHQPQGERDSAASRATNQVRTWIPLCSNEDGGAAVQHARGRGPQAQVRESTCHFRTRHELKGSEGGWRRRRS
jgi:hypothetical protein